MVEVKNEGRDPLLNLNKMALGETIKVKKINDFSVRRTEREGKFGPWTSYSTMVEFEGNEMWCWMKEKVAVAFDAVTPGTTLLITKSSFEKDGRIFPKFEVVVEGAEAPSSSTPLASGEIRTTTIPYTALKIPSRDIHKPTGPEKLSIHERDVLGNLASDKDRDNWMGAKIDYNFFKDIMKASEVPGDEDRYKWLHKTYGEIVLAVRGE